MECYFRTKADWPIPLKELQTRRNECRNRDERFGLVFLVAFFSALFGFRFIVGWIEESLTGPQWAEPALTVIFFVVVIGVFPFIYFTMRNRLRAFDLVCPACGKMIYSWSMTTIIETSRCSHCGTTLVTDALSRTEPGEGGNSE